MANYNLVVNSTFQPFSFERYLQPLQIYGQSYKELENQYAALSEQSALLASQANAQTDPNAYNTYKKYSDDLAAKADALIKSGLNTNSRSSLLNLRSRYNKEITPINQAITKRAKDAEVQQQARLNNSSLMFSRDASTTSLDDYLTNPQLQYNAISGNDLTAQVAAASSALAKEIQDSPDKMKSILGGDYYEYVKSRGFSSKAVAEAIQRSPNASKVLTGLVDNVISSSGISNWNDKNALTKAYDYASRGLYASIGGQESQLTPSWRAQENLSNANAMARQASSQAFQRSEREAAQKFALEQSAPKPMVDANGNPTGTYYNTKTKTIIDANGNVIANSRGGVTASGLINTKEKEKFDRISDTEGLKKLGYTPVFATMKLKGSWKSAAEGEDAPGVYAGYTRSRLVQDKTGPDWAFANFGMSGNVSYTPRKGGTMSVVNDLSSIPEDARKSLIEKAKSLNLDLDEDVQIMRVLSERGSGANPDDNDYIIFTKNQ